MKYSSIENMRNIKLRSSDNRVDTMEGQFLYFFCDYELMVIA